LISDRARRAYGALVLALKREESRGTSLAARLVGRILVKTGRAIGANRLSGGISVRAWRASETQRESSGGSVGRNRAILAFSGAETVLIAADAAGRAGRGCVQRLIAARDARRTEGRSSRVSERSRSAFYAIAAPCVALEESDVARIAN
jgi:hypothetical protein